MDGSHTVMSVFKVLGAEQIPNVRLTKIGCVDGCPPKISVGQIVYGTLDSKVEIGFSFNIRNATVRNLALPDVKWRLWWTSIIQKILTEDTFQTKNSIYKWEMI